MFLYINFFRKSQIWNIIDLEEMTLLETESGKQYYNVFFFSFKFKLCYPNISSKRKRRWYAESRHSSCCPGTFAVGKRQLHAIRSNYQELPFLPHSNHFDDRLLCTVKQNGNLCCINCLSASFPSSAISLPTSFIFHTLMVAVTLSWWCRVIFTETLIRNHKSAWCAFMV